MKNCKFLFTFLFIFVFSSRPARGDSSLYEKLLEAYKKPIEDETWHGKWLPLEIPKPQARSEHKSDMSRIDKTCDDGRANITLDWPTSYADFICMKEYLMHDRNVKPVIRIADIPKSYTPQHICMNQCLEYDTSPPLFGPHRKIWARWGEYKYLPPQRWIHNLEHGGVVLLYHPCAQPFLVDILKTIVSSCLKRHIITPYQDLPLQTPLAILTWGKGYFMPDIDMNNVIKFIKSNALKGPENMSDDGLYDYKLLKPASIVSTENDAEICPVTPDI